MTVFFYGTAWAANLQRPASAVTGDIVIASVIECGYVQVNPPTTMPTFDTIAGFTEAAAFSGPLGPIFTISGTDYRRWGIGTVQYKTLAAPDSAWSVPTISGSFTAIGSLADGIATGDGMTWVVQGAGTITATFTDYQATGTSGSFDATPAAASSTQIGLSHVHCRTDNATPDTTHTDVIRIRGGAGTWGPIYSYASAGGDSGSPVFTATVFNGGLKSSILAS